MIGAIVALAPAGVLRLQDAAIDLRMLMFAVLVTSAAAVAFGILPAIQFSRPGRDAMRERTAAAPRGSFRRTLVAAEIALAVVLLTSAGLLLRSFERLMAVDPGFSPRNTIALQVFAHDRNGTPERTRSFSRTTIERIQALPGVEAAGTASAMPFANANIDIKSGLEVIGREQKAHGRSAAGVRHDCDARLLSRAGHPASGRTVSRGGRRRESGAGGGDQRSIAPPRMAR